MTQQQFPSEQVVNLTVTPSQVELLQEGIGLLIEQEERKQLACQHLNSYMTFLASQLNPRARQDENQS